VCYAVNVRGEWCDRIGELRRAVPCEPQRDPAYATLPPDDACLCGCDIEATLNAAGVQWERDDCGDYHVWKPVAQAASP